jgi:DNA-binding MarR family transcriptional regulator
MDMKGASEPETVPRTLGRLRVALADAYLRASRELGLTAQQAELLCAAMRPSAIGDLAQVLRCDRSNVSRLVDRASSRGLLERHADDSDGRVNLVELTDEGEALARQFIAALEQQLDDVLDQWSPQKQRSAVRLMTEIADALDAPRIDPRHHPRPQ